MGAVSNKEGQVDKERERLLGELARWKNTLGLEMKTTR